jgi:hypothetical protein
MSVLREIFKALRNTKKSVIKELDMPVGIEEARSFFKNGPLPFF